MSRRSLLFTLWVIQGLIAVLWLALLPSDTQNNLAFGFSAIRLLLIGLALALTAGSALLAWRVRRAEAALNAHFDAWAGPLALLAVLVAPAGILVLRALGQTSGFTYAAYADRLAPLAFWLTLSALELLVLLAWQDRSEIRASWQPLGQLGLAAAGFLGALALVALFVAWTRIGLNPSPDTGSWGAPTTPLLEWQILLALAASLVVLLLASRLSLPRHERWILVLVYALTCLLWLAQPINPGFFATKPRAPNYEIYPFSDAQIYAQYAQSALLGHGFMWPDVPARPLYIAFLTWIHALAGQQYTHVIALQSVVLAAFPLVLYLLGRELGGRPLGIGLALLATLRDLTANVAAPFALNYTYSKLFFSETPAALLIALFVVMAIRWMKAYRNTGVPAQTVRSNGRFALLQANIVNTNWYPLLAGGVLGLAALIRLQSAVILLAVIPIGFFVIRNHGRWLRGSALLVLGTLLALAPWFARNYLATGGLVLDNPTSQSMVLAERWTGNPDDARFQYLPGEGEAHYTARMTQIALQGFSQKPQGILGAAIRHFFNSEIGNLLVFPLRDRLDGPAELLWPQHAFWQTWAGQPDGAQSALIALYLALLGCGLAAALYRHGPLGLLPFGIGLAYNAWTALFLSSGDRFLVPVDWGVYLYQFMGLLTLADLGLTLLKSTREAASSWIGLHPDGAATEAPAAHSWRGLIACAALILLLGACVPLTELVFPQYPAIELSHAPASVGQVVLSGRAIYPRYYAAGRGEPGTAKTGYAKSEQARLVFFLAGAQNILVVLPLRYAPDFFPNAADVTVVGTQTAGYLSATDVVVEKTGKTAQYMP